MMETQTSHTPRQGDIPAAPPDDCPAVTARAARQKRAADLAISDEDAAAVLGFCHSQLLSVAAATDGEARARLTTPAAFTAWAPLVSVARLRGWADSSLLTRHLLRGAALAEVVDLAGVLDRLNGLPPSPLGALQVTHLAAVVASLVPRWCMADVAGSVLGACARLEERAPGDDGGGAGAFAARGLAATILSAWALLERRPVVRVALQSTAGAVMGRSAPLSAFLAGEEWAEQQRRLALAYPDPRLVHDPSSSGAERRPTQAPLPADDGVPTPPAGGLADCEPEAAVTNTVDAQFWRDLVS